MQLPAKVNQKLAIEIPEEFKDVFDLSKNMEGVVPRLPQIKIGHSAQVFKMPDETKTEEFEGIIIDQHPANAWWEKDPSENSDVTLPDCFSKNGEYPEADSKIRQYKNCADCPQNQFGSSRKGDGKDCKNMKRFHIIMEDSLLPRRFTVPPSSLVNADIFLAGLVDKGLPYMAVTTIFTLESKIAGGNEYSVIHFQRNRVIEQEEIPIVAELVRKYKESARGQDIHADEYGATEKEESGYNESDSVPDNDIPF